MAKEKTDTAPVRVEEDIEELENKVTFQAADDQVVFDDLATRWTRWSSPTSADPEEQPRAEKNLRRVFELFNKSEQTMCFLFSLSSRSTGKISIGSRFVANWNSVRVTENVINQLVFTLIETDAWNKGSWS